MKKIMDKMELLKKVPDLYDFTLNHCFVAGGAIRDINRSVEPKDYDLFFRTKEAIDEFKTKFSKYMEETGLGNFNYGKDIQFITINYGTPEKVVGEFDWNVNQVYYEFNRLTSYKLVSRFIAMFRSNDTELVFNINSSYPLSAFLRLPYMIQKGFTISPKEFAFVTAYISARGFLNSEEEMKKQMSIVPSSESSKFNIEGTVQRAQALAIKKSPLMNSLKEEEPEALSALDLL
jgi:hypothetical protein